MICEKGVLRRVARCAMSDHEGAFAGFVENALRSAESEEVEEEGAGPAEETAESESEEMTASMEAHYRETG